MANDEGRVASKKRSSTEREVVPPVCGYILAGGVSSRFGQDKALVEIGGHPVLARIHDLIFDTVTREVRVIGAPNKYEVCGAKCVADRWPGEGPLGGIITALLETGKRKPACKWNLIVSCDMPFLNEEILVYCVDRAKKSDADVVLPLSQTGFEPLCACWRTQAAKILLPAFERGVRKVMDGVGLLKAEMLDEKDWKRFDSAGRLFLNMNTHAEYEEARRILEAERR